MKKTGNGIGESASNTAVVEQTKPVSHTHPTPAMEAGLREKLERLVAGYQHDPFSCLGLHPEKNGWVIRVWRPDAVTVKLVTARGEEPMARIHEAGIFEWRSGEISGATTSAGQPERPWALRVDEYLEVDAYAFTPQTSDEFLHLFSEGRQLQGYRTFGAHHEVCMGIAGVRFRVWAPNAERVSVVGDFNQWDGRRHGMVSLGLSGVWEIFVPGARAGQAYKYEIRSRISGAMFLRLDPFAREAEVRPSTASRIPQPSQHAWQDEAWLEQRSRWDWQHAPVNIYEVHAGSWMRHPDGRFYSYRDMAERLVPYVVEHGFTHIEFMPLTEHPLDESWGYQTTGYFAPTSRFGSPDDLKYLIDTCHQAGIGVLLDWVPGHFPQDEGALAYFDGSALYEHEDPRLGKQPDWGTHVFNFGRHEVRGFLLSSAHWWLSEFHFDGLRVDAVASMLYLDYSRKEGEWLPNRYGGKENLDAIDFLRELNVMVHGEFPGALTIAEESTAWPLVSRPTYLGGLGFSFKWNMGWMNDTLDYLRHDPVYRRYHHDRLTFGQLYAYSENYVLPLSHDEVVHGKGSLYGKMPGDNWQRLANARLLLAYQMTSPGKKLGFMGNELAGPREWNCSWELDWWLLEDPQHRGVQRLVRDLNHLYRDVPALHDLDCEGTGFSWIDCHDADHSVISWLRRARDGSFVVVVMNCTPVPRLGYRLGVPESGYYRERINTDSEYYCGSNIGNGEGLYAEPLPWMGYPASVVLTLPPLSMVALVKG